MLRLMIQNSNFSFLPRFNVKVGNVIVQQAKFINLLWHPKCPMHSQAKEEDSRNVINNASWIWFPKRLKSAGYDILVQVSWYARWWSQPIFTTVAPPREVRTFGKIIWSRNIFRIWETCTRVNTWTQAICAYRKNHSTMVIVCILQMRTFFEPAYPQKS